MQGRSGFGVSDLIEGVLNLLVSMEDLMTRVEYGDVVMSSTVP